MPLIEWSDTYSVGVAAMDEHHKKLVGLINNLNDAMSQGQGKEAIGGILTELVDYTKFHFSEEEKLMAEKSYAGLDEQKEKHAGFIAKITEFQGKFAADPSSVTMEVSTFLRDWLIGHIMKMDKEYGPALA